MQGVAFGITLGIISEEKKSYFKLHVIKRTLEVVTFSDKILKK